MNDKGKIGAGKGAPENENEEETVESFLGKLFEAAGEEGEPVAEPENLLARKLRDRIRKNGPLTLHDYMQACAADPEHGYYIVRDPFGAGGDFITAPDICQVFGELLGLWCVHVWAELGQPAHCRLVELGPGRGTLMSDALRAASLVPEFLQSVEVHMVETSAALARVQEEQIRGQAEDQERFLPALHWHQRLEDVPEGPTLLIANEFLDALPIRQFQKRNGEWFERMVTLDAADQFVFTLSARPQTDLTAFPVLHATAKNGDFIEYCPLLPSIVDQLSKRASRHSLAGVFIDYGYGEPALGDTFQAVRGHEFVDPLHQPGIADVTAHVDFSRLLHLARGMDLQAFGVVTQRDFLIALGVRERAAQLMQGMENMMAAHQFITGFQRLIDPAEMGALFKVVALAGAGQPELPGFDWKPDGKADFTME